MVAQIPDIVCRTIVGKIQIIGLGRIFSRQCINLFDNRFDASTDAVVAYRIIRKRFFENQFFDLMIGKSSQFCFSEQFRRKFFQRIVLLHFTGNLYDIFQFVKKPFVDFGQLIQSVHRIILLQSLRKIENALIGGSTQFFVQLIGKQIFVADKTMHALLNHAQPFLEHFLKSAPDGHDFTHRFHAAAQFTRDTVKFCQIPTRNFADNIIESRLKKGRRNLRNRIFQFGKPVTQSQFGSNKSQRISGCLGSESRRTAETGIHLNHPIIFRCRIESILHIALANDSDVANDADG